MDEYEVNANIKLPKEHRKKYSEAVKDGYISAHGGGPEGRLEAIGAYYRYCEVQEIPFVVVKNKIKYSILEVDTIFLRDKAGVKRWAERVNEEVFAKSTWTEGSGRTFCYASSKVYRLFAARRKDLDDETGFGRTEVKKEEAEALAKEILKIYKEEVNETE